MSPKKQLPPLSKSIERMQKFEYEDISSRLKESEIDPNCVEHQVLINEYNKLRYPSSYSWTSRGTASPKDKPYTKSILITNKSDKEMTPRMKEVPPKKVCTRKCNQNSHDSFKCELCDVVNITKDMILSTYTTPVHSIEPAYNQKQKKKVRIVTRQLSGYNEPVKNPLIQKKRNRSEKSDIYKTPELKMLHKRSISPEKQVTLDEDADKLNLSDNIIVYKDKSLYEGDGLNQALENIVLEDSKDKIYDPNVDTEILESMKNYIYPKAKCLLTNEDLKSFNKYVKETDYTRPKTVRTQTDKYLLPKRPSTTKMINSEENESLILIEHFVRPTKIISFDKLSDESDKSIHDLYSNEQFIHTDVSTKFNLVQTNKLFNGRKLPPLGKSFQQESIISTIKDLYPDGNSITNEKGAEKGMTSSDIIGVIQGNKYPTLADKFPNLRKFRNMKSDAKSVGIEEFLKRTNEQKSSKVISPRKDQAANTEGKFEKTIICFPDHTAMPQTAQDKSQLIDKTKIYLDKNFLRTKSKSEGTFLINKKATTKSIEYENFNKIDDLDHLELKTEVDNKINKKVSNNSVATKIYESMKNSKIQGKAVENYCKSTGRKPITKSKIKPQIKRNYLEAKVETKTTRKNKYPVATKVAPKNVATKLQLKKATSFRKKNGLKLNTTYINSSFSSTISERHEEERISVQLPKTNAFEEAELMLNFVTSQKTNQSANSNRNKASKTYPITLKASKIRKVKAPKDKNIFPKNSSQISKTGTKKLCIEISSNNAKRPAQKVPLKLQSAKLFQQKEVKKANIIKKISNIKESKMKTNIMYKYDAANFEDTDDDSEDLLSISKNNTEMVYRVQISPKISHKLIVPPSTPLEPNVIVIDPPDNALSNNDSPYDDVIDLRKYYDPPMIETAPIYDVFPCSTSPSPVLNRNPNITKISSVDSDKKKKTKINDFKERKLNSPVSSSQNKKGQGKRGSKTKPINVQKIENYNTFKDELFTLIEQPTTQKVNKTSLPKDDVFDYFLSDCTAQLSPLNTQRTQSHKSITDTREKEDLHYTSRCDLNGSIDNLKDTKSLLESISKEVFKQSLTDSHVTMSLNNKTSEKIETCGSFLDASKRLINEQVKDYIVKETDIPQSDSTSNTLNTDRRRQSVDWKYYLEKPENYDSPNNLYRRSIIINSNESRKSSKMSQTNKIVLDIDRIRMHQERMRSVRQETTLCEYHRKRHERVDGASGDDKMKDTVRINQEIDEQRIEVGENESEILARDQRKCGKFWACFHLFFPQREERYF